jgi:hypothetical protein
LHSKQGNSSFMLLEGVRTAFDTAVQTPDCALFGNAACMPQDQLPRAGLRLALSQLRLAFALIHQEGVFIRQVLP